MKNISYTNLHDDVVSGGASFNVDINGELTKVEQGESGYMVALPKHLVFDHITGVWAYDCCDAGDYEQFEKLVNRTLDDISKIYAQESWTHNKLHLGLWADLDCIWVEISVRVASVFDAIVMGRLGQQMSIYDIQNQDIISC